MEDKKTKVKGSIKKFTKKYGPALFYVGASCGLGVYLGMKVHKKGFYDGFDAVCNAIVGASYDGDGLRLANHNKDTYIFKATKVLKD